MTSGIGAIAARLMSSRCWLDVGRVWAKGEAKALLAVLEARGLRISDEVRGRVLACTDAAKLEAWIHKAVTVASVDELF